MTPLQKLPNNVGDLCKIIVATGFEWLPKVQLIAKSGHTVILPTALSLGCGVVERLLAMAWPIKAKRNLANFLKFRLSICTLIEIFKRRFADLYQRLGQERSLMP